jgi:hypothetical protein
MKRPRLRTRKILIASIGAATVTYALTACDKQPHTTGNLMYPQFEDAAAPILDAESASVGASDATATGVLLAPGLDAQAVLIATSGNLMAPTPDAGFRLHPAPSANPAKPPR